MKLSDARTGLFRYVRYGDVDRMHALGWMVVADLGQPHREYSCLMWHCDCGEVTL